MQDAEKFFPLEDEYPHPVGDDPWWQESVFLTWWDHKNGVGGFHRIGHEPRAGEGGMATSWIGIFTQDGLRYRQHLYVPLRAGDRGTDTFRCSDAHAMRHDGRNAIWTIEDPDCRMHLEAGDYTPRFDLFQAGGTVTDDFAPGHFEAGGPIRGTLQLGDRRYEINGICYRDHSWGRREWSTLLSHRWIAGSCGPALTFNAASWHGTDGSLRSFGIVARDGRIDRADVDILVYMEIDACTHRGGRLTLNLHSGERIVLEPTPVDGAVTLHHNIACVDQLCLVDYNGHQGFCDFEITTNPRAGSGPIRSALRATMESGLSRRPAEHRP
jgi:hypothetical protein